MFQQRFAHQLLFSDMDAREFGVRDEKTRTLARKEWTFMTHNETLHKILKRQSSHHTDHDWLKEIHADDCPMELVAAPCNTF